ncbi:MAG: hypothetical protein NT038_06630 [Euryarchaeota archaeon]|nr:hypothetical protein [Euryarchaeota archaeon]
MRKNNKGGRKKMVDIKIQATTIAIGVASGITPLLCKGITPFQF